MVFDPWRNINMSVVLPATPYAIPKRPKIRGLVEDRINLHHGFLGSIKIKESFNKADSADLSDSLKELLKLLAITVGRMIEPLPKKQAEQVANDLQILINEATSEMPRRKWWELSVQGIKEAAKKNGQDSISVLATLDSIIPILEERS
jgi:hypothetical protein